MTDSKPLLFVLGASHKTAPTALREHLYLSEDQLSALLPQVKEKFGLTELAALSTCNRFELFGTLHDHGDGATKIYQAFLELQRRDREHTHHAEEEIRSSLYLHLGQEAVSHLFKVAASLDSLVLGETQITGQFKDALALAQKFQTSGPLITRLGQEALSLAKKVRTQTDIGKKHVSISHAAVELAQKVFGRLSDHCFLIIGAGEMSQVAAKYIKSYNPKALYIANRTVAKAQQICHELGMGEAYSLDELLELIVRSDIVICSTAAPGYVLTRAMIERAQTSRKGRPLVLLDIALPRDIEPEISDLEDVYLFDIDDLKQVVGANLEERRKAAEQAEEMVTRSVAQFEGWLKNLSIKPIIGQFRTYLDQTITRELNRTLSKDLFKSSPRHSESLQALCQAIGSKIAADAAKTLMAPPGEIAQETLAAALSVLFAPFETSTPEGSIATGSQLSTEGAQEKTREQSSEKSPLTPLLDKVQ
jgi:glutamyl-tRNA reductase